MIEPFDLKKLKTTLELLKPLLFPDTNQRVVEKLKNENGGKGFSLSYIIKVRAGHKYVPEIINAIIEVAKENKEKFQEQMKEIEDVAS